jgi:hypothetical protein
MPSLSLRPDDSLTIPKMALSMGFKQSVTLLPAILANGFWLLPMQVYLLLNTPAFSGRAVVDKPLRLNLLDFTHFSCSRFDKSPDWNDGRIK